jgi:hypothetical protein
MISIYHFKIHWFIITGLGSYCLTTRFTGSSLLGVVRIVSFHELLAHSYWAGIYSAYLTGSSLFSMICIIISSFTGSSLLGIVLLA